MLNLRMLKLSDLWLWICVGLLVLLGLLAIFSSTQAKLIYVNRQLVSLLVGLAGLAVFSYFDYKHLKRFSIALYLLMLLMLVVVLFVGGGGAQRWFQIGPFSFQPSEVSKIFMIICLASYLSDRKKLDGFWSNIFLLAIVGLPFLLIFKQPDLGTALVFMAILVGLLLASWSSPKLLIYLLPR